MMQTYICDDFRPVKAGSISEAACIFAGRAARRAFGRKGYVRTMTDDGWTRDGSFLSVRCFVGIDRREHNSSVCVGRETYLAISEA